ncbi:MAG: helix-turn-helix transcriptional regulator [Lachnospiraceae bacterium]|nr:helix-turn-helix transcriptional regulator [Lachnospiraceae bacterium]
MTLGEKIRKRRIELNMTMDDLGNAIGVQRSAINKYEKGMITDLKRSTIHALATALQVSPLYLLDDDNGDDERLEALHQNPQLGLLFDRSRKMSSEDVEFMLQMADRILKERGD